MQLDLSRNESKTSTTNFQDEEFFECRICHDKGHRNDLIVPCKCDGSMKFVHRNCLDSWRVSGIKSGSYFTCGQCKFNYVLIDSQKANLSRQAIVKYILLIAMDIILPFLALNVLIALLGYHSDATFQNCDVDGMCQIGLRELLRGWALVVSLILISIGVILQVIPILIDSDGHRECILQADEKNGEVFLCFSTPSIIFSTIGVACCVYFALVYYYRMQQDKSRRIADEVFGIRRTVKDLHQDTT